MKHLLPIAAIFSCCCAYAQNPIDNYTTSNNNFTEIGTGLGAGVGTPQDLDFVPGRPNELWVLNKESVGGSFNIFFNAGKSNQTMQFRRDSHSDHFMIRSVAFAFGDKDFFATAQEIQNTNPQSPTFMGPALWNSDTSIFARKHQSNWDPNLPLGSHIDMLHESPYGMGIAHDNANVYWYFDGHYGNICRYDFADPHGIGEDDHSDGKILRYSDIKVTRVPNQPSHMVVDKQNKWLYYIDGSTKKVMRLNTASGTQGQNLQVTGENVALYKEVTGATVETVVSTGLTKPVGIDYRKDRLLVSDMSTGDIMIYNTTSMPAQLVGTIHTGGPGVMGVRIDNDNRIWYVNNTTKKVHRIDNPKVAAVDDMPGKGFSFNIYPNPAGAVLNISIDNANAAKTDISIFDMAGRQVFATSTTHALTTINTGAWAKGVYQVVLNSDGNAASSQVVIK